MLTVRAARTRLVGIGVVAVLATGAAACGDDSSDELPPPRTDSSPTVPAEPTPTLDPEEAEVLAVVEGWLDALVQVRTAPDPRAEALTDWAINASVDFEIRLIEGDLGHGHAYAGTIELVEAVVTDLVHGDEPGVAGATVEACLDGSDWRQIDLETGEPTREVGDDEVLRHTATLRLRRSEEHGWRFYQSAMSPAWMGGSPEEPWQEEFRC